MTLGALGGQLKPLTRAEVLELADASPVTGTTMAARALGVSEPLLRDLARNGDLERMGVRVLRLGRVLKFATADIVRVLGLDPQTDSAGSGGTDPAVIRPLHPIGTDDHDTPAA